MRRILECTGALFLLAGLIPSSAEAGERVILSSGFELHADRHELSGEVVKVFSGSGVTELPVALIAEFRAEEYTAPSSVPAPIPVEAAAKAVTPRDFIQAAVVKHNLPKELLSLVESVVRQESGFRAGAISPKGAIGLMQLMPGTARELGVDPRDPAQNVDAGTRYLTALLEKYENRDDQVIRALAAYNAGPGAVEKYNGVPPYRETRDYVRRVVRNYLKDQAEAR